MKKRLPERENLADSDLAKLSKRNTIYHFRVNAVVYSVIYEILKKHLFSADNRRRRSHCL